MFVNDQSSERFPAIRNLYNELTFNPREANLRQLLVNVDSTLMIRTLAWKTLELAIPEIVQGGVKKGWPRYRVDLFSLAELLIITYDAMDGDLERCSDIFARVNRDFQHRKFPFLILLVQGTKREALSAIDQVCGLHDRFRDITSDALCSAAASLLETREDPER